MRKKGMMLASAVMGLLMAAPMVAGAAAKDGGDQVICDGINACKGQGSCAGAGHACAGQNGCKGQGHTKTSKKDCLKKGGKVVKKADEEKKG